jgi:para-aminobenzoate synthetase component 1
LPENYQAQLGDIIYSLLPAGSISGTPKKKSLEIIDAAETYDRGYYTGIVGYFDGENFDSGVMIRFIENNHGKKVYKSGGGIHFLSDVRAEYQEMKDKVYVSIH